MEKTIYVNRPASRTWNRLGVNEAAVRWDTDAETLLSNERFTAVSGENAPLRIEAADGGAAYGRRVYTVTAEAGAELTVFEVCTAAQPLAAELRLTAAEGAHLRVVQLLNPTRGAVLRHELSAQLAEHAKLDLISLQLGDGAVYADHQIALAGDGAALRVDLGYLARRSDTADIDLTVEQLKQMFTGEITNWSEVGGDDGEIVLIGREAGSGTRDGFESIVDVKDSCKYAQELTATGAVISAVEANPLAIGYASLSAVGDTVKMVTVGGVECSEETVKDGSYEVQRPFVFVTNKSATLSEQAQAFFDFATSADAADLIRTAGAVPVNE